MRLLILGGGNAQLTAIKRAKEKGHTIIVTDYYSDAPGKEYADYSELVSTFDVEGNISLAKKYRIDGVMTLGTDQPVLTAARVAQKRGLPTFIDAETALAVTNKRKMKSVLEAKGIPLVPYKLVKEGFPSSQLGDIKFPVVMKPVDSQGQRGVYKLSTLEEVRAYLRHSLSYSRENQVVVEEYYESQEITVSGWVEGGKVHFITIIDRISMERGVHLGICTSHHFPSSFMSSHYEEIRDVSERAVRALGIMGGPVYFQLLVGREGIMVNEVSCRVGGAHEDELFAALAGINILDLIIDGALGLALDLRKVKSHRMLNLGEKASVELVFARPGKVRSLGDTREAKKISGVVQARYYVGTGHQVGEINNATQRVGYMIVLAPSEDELKERLTRAYELYRLEDERGENMILHTC